MKMIEVSSNSESECELYTNTAKNIALEKRRLKEKRDELEQVINLASDDDLENVAKELNAGNSPSSALLKARNEHFDFLNPNLAKINSDSDDDDVPLATLRRSLIMKRRKQVQSSQQKKARPSQRKRNRRRGTRGRNTSVIVFDDDTGYDTTSHQPIDFKSRAKKKSASKDKSVLDLSLNSILNIEPDKKESFDDSDDEDVKIFLDFDNGEKITNHAFTLRKYQKLEFIFNEIAEKESLSTNHILVMRHCIPVNPSDTPETLDLKYYAGLTGSISPIEIDYRKEFLNTKEHTTNGRTEDLIKVILRLESKQTYTFTINKNQKSSVLYKKCSEELKCEESKIKLMFDGELVELSDRVSDLEIEDGDVFDVLLNK